MCRKPKRKMSQDGHPSSRHALSVGSSSGGASGSKSVALVRIGKEDEVPLSRPIDMISAVKEFHALSKEDLSKLIKDGKDGHIQWTKADGTSFEINVKDMARKLSFHLVGYYLESKQDEELFKYLLAGVRLLHILCDLASHHRLLKKVLFKERKASRQTAKLVSSMICFLRNTGEKIDASSDIVHLHSALLASTLYLFKSIVYGQRKWNDHDLLLDFFKPEDITCLGFEAVGSVIKFLHVKLVRMQSSNDEMDHLFQLFEASLQFFYSLTQENIFRKRAIDQNKVTKAVKYDESLVDQKIKVWWPEDKVFYEGVIASFNAHTKKHQVLYLDGEEEILNLETEKWEPIQKYSEVLCEGDVVFKLVQDIMKLPERKDAYLSACIYRLKTKALYIMLYLCEAASSSFLKLYSDIIQGDIAKSTLSEVLEVLKKMFCGELKDHPRGTLQLNAMRIAENFAYDIDFQPYVALNLAESLTRVFTQPHKEFLRNWCSSERDPIEEDVHLEFDSVAAAGEILGVIPRLDVSKSTYSTSRALQTPYAHQKSSLLIKIIANLTCFNSDTPKGDKGLLVNKFFQSLQMEHPNLLNGAACSSGERAAVAFKNLHSFLAHAGSLVPEYNILEDVNHLSLFIKKLEALLAPQVSHNEQPGNEGTPFYSQREMNEMMKKHEEEMAAQKLENQRQQENFNRMVSFLSQTQGMSELANMFPGSTTEVGSTSGTTPSNNDPSSSGNPEDDGEDENDGSGDLWAFQ